MTLLPSKMNLNMFRIKQVQFNRPLDDPHFREPIGERSYTSEIYVRAQIYWNEDDDKSPGWTGNLGESDGRLVFKQSDLWDVGIELHRGDRITGVWQANDTWKDYDLEITHLLPRGHLPTSLILFAYFTENTETRGSI